MKFDSLFDNRNLLFIAVSLMYTYIIVVHIQTGITKIPWACYPPFADMITITGSVECANNGFDPYVHTAFDPWGRQYNYPKLWLSIFNFFNLGSNSTNAIAIILIYLTPLSAIFLFKFKRKIQVIVCYFLLISPTILLLLERGNSDSIVFISLAVSLFYIRKGPFWNTLTKVYISYTIIIILAMLKIYPIFLLGLLVYEKISLKHKLVIFGSSLLVLLGYVIFTLDDLNQIFAISIFAKTTSYGKNIYLNTIMQPIQLKIFTNSLIAMVGIISILINLRFKNHLNLIMPNSKAHWDNNLLFLTGSLIYLGSFFNGGNFDYRLVFLLFCLPLLFNLWKSKGKIWCIVMVAAYFLLFYGSYWGHYGFFKLDKKAVDFELIKYIASWIVFLLLSIGSLHFLATSLLNKKKRLESAI